MARLLANPSATSRIDGSAFTHLNSAWLTAGKTQAVPSVGVAEAAALAVALALGAPSPAACTLGGTFGSRLASAAGMTATSNPPDVCAAASSVNGTATDAGSTHSWKYSVSNGGAGALM